MIEGRRGAVAPTLGGACGELPTDILSHRDATPEVRAAPDARLACFARQRIDGRRITREEAALISG